MSKPPEHSHNLSMWLSEVLQDIHVTKTMVMKRRRILMITEAIMNIHDFLQDANTRYIYLGSQSEASTTRGLKSDIDCLKYRQDIQVIQELSQWRPDILQYLMVQDETVSPGYCLLQRLRNDVALPEHDFHDENHSIDSRGRVLLRHSFCKKCLEGAAMHGPALSISRPGCYDVDCVTGLYCPSWPKEAIPWLQQQNISGWPTEHMKRYSADQGCFVVPIASREGLYQDLEWRISTCLAERYLMNKLNITQLRCYILMKMVLKTFLKPICGEAVSSFICKNILFYSVSGSEVNSTWNEGCLVTRFIQCLEALLQCILDENCPHFIIPRNNLLAGKLSSDMKRQLEDVMRTITGNIEQSLLNIQIDNLRLHLRCKLLNRTNLIEFLSKISKVSIQLDVNDNFLIPHERIAHLSREVLICIGFVQLNIPKNGDTNAHYLKNIISKLDQFYREGSDYEKVAVSLLRPFLCTTIGSIKASEDIQHSQNISPDALNWFSRGLNSDVCSSMLKKASALYCAGQSENCEMILTAVSQKITHTTVKSICKCNIHPQKYTADFGKLCFQKNENTIKHNIAFCVTYMQCEINCIPGQLKYEMFRSTEEDLSYRDPDKHFWMDWAVVDSKPYLYFLQYMVYSQLRRPADQHKSLDKLARTIGTDPDLGHRETALNLLGQCMEQKNWLQLALYCYKLSLSIKERNRNNAANWHVCRLLARLVRSRSQ